MAGILSGLLTHDGDNVPQIDATRAGPGMAYAAMISNQMTRILVEIAAIKFALQTRGLVTEHEFMQAMSAVTSQANATINQFKQFTPPPNNRGLTK